MNNEPLKLPFGSELSPDVIELPYLLEVCYDNSGDKSAIEGAFLNKYFLNSGGSAKNRRTMAMNCRLSLQNYLLLDNDFKLTEVGESLYELRNNEEELNKAFAKHILLNLNGLAFIQCLKEMYLAGEPINLTTLRKALAIRNVHYPSGGKHPSIMRLWLEKAGVISSRWNVDNDKVKEVLGSEDVTDALSGLNNLQRAFLKALVNSGITELQSASNVVKLANATYGVEFPEKSLPKMVLNKLVEDGFIIAEKTTSGRGAKPFNVKLAPDVKPALIIPTLQQLENTLDPKLHSLILKPLSEILTEIDSTDTYTSGLALEALAFKLMQIIDIDYVATRLRGEATGGAEVDLVFESTRLVYSRWQIQCKNTKHVTLDPVAKEVGLTHFLKSNVIIIVTTGTFSSEAVRYSNQIMRDSNLSIVLIDKFAIQKILENPVNIVDVLNSEARKAMELKRIEI